MYILFADMGNGDAITRGFSNRQLLSQFSGINYNTLTNHFVRQKEVYHYYPDKKVMVIKVTQIEKNTRRIERIHKGHNRNI